MQWTNSTDGYGWLSITLHWLAAVAVIVMLSSGFGIDIARDTGGRAARATVMAWHISFGATFFVILLALVISSYAQQRPTPPEQPSAFKFIASATHHLLLLAIIVQIISGPLAVWSGGHAINAWDLFSIPSPFAERNQNVHELAELIHRIGRGALVVLISLHVLGALKHLFIDRDGVVGRMLAPPKQA